MTQSTRHIDLNARDAVQRLDDAGLLATLLEPRARSESAVERARHALRQHGGLRGLWRACPSEIATLGPHGAHWARQIAAARELSRRQLQDCLQRGSALTSPADTIEYLRTALQDRRREIFCCLFLDTRHRVMACEELFQGSIDGASVYPRVVAERALRLGAAAVIVAHNHPSGVTEPSLADQAITRRLKDALALLEIRLLDHFVIGDGLPASMASRGMI